MTDAAWKLDLIAQQVNEFKRNEENMGKIREIQKILGVSFCFSLFLPLNLFQFDWVGQ